MAGFRAPDSSFLLLCLVVLVFCVGPSHAFGAGNIASVSKVEGVNWRHGDIEDTLLTILASRAANKKFSKLDVKRVYFGNWLRDYSQAVDVGALKMVSAEAIRLLLWILGFISFGYGTKEFEVTTERLGCYRPEEHIDNPKDYADNEDARRYDRRLRGPVDERRELAIDENTGLKNYIANEQAGITTSAGLVRDLLRRCIEQGRRARRDRDDNALYEAFRLLGTSNHCLEDFSAHSNYVELALVELGERDIFPHVGRNTRVRVRGARNDVWPLVTGTFGGVDFLHSVMGEVSDKATQSEIEELEGTISAAERNRKASSVIQDLLDKLPDGILGGGESEKASELQQNANAAQMQNLEISPKDPEEFTRQAEDLRRQIYPVIEFHDNLMREITETIDKIPILPELLEQLQEQLNIFVFGLIAPYILPVIKQVKAELSTGSSEIINNSRQQQLVVFHDDSSSDPTHSMISKDHFSNVLNEPAGKVATQVIKWAVPQIVECWDDERADVDRTINRIINGVFHHPALRDGGDDGARDGRALMFRVVESWWQGQSDRSRNDLRDKLSREGVENGRNHKEGVHDKGHGCGKPLGMPNLGTASSSGAIGGVLGAGILGGLNQAAGNKQSGGYGSSQHDKISQDVGNKVGEAVGGGFLGSIVGGVVGGVGGSLLSGAFEGEKKSSSHAEGYSQDGGYTQKYSESGRRDDGGGYGQAQYQRTDYPGGGRREEYTRHEETQSSYGGGYERTEERRTEYSSGGGYRQESHTETTYGGGEYGESKHYGKKDKDKYKSKDKDSEDSGEEDDYEKRAKKERKKREKEEKKRRKELEYASSGYRKKKDEDSDDDDDDDDSEDEKKKYKKHGSDKYRSRRDDDDDNDRRRNRSSEREERQEYGGGRQEYGGGRQEYGQTERQEYGGGRQEYGGGRQEYGGGRQEYGGERQEYGGERQEYGSSGYGQSERQEYGGDGGGYGSRRDDDNEGGGYGSRRRDDDDDDNEYGNRRRRDDEDQSSGYGQSGGYGGGGGYGDRY